MKVNILDIKNPLLVFNGPTSPKGRYKELMLHYHPDKYPDDRDWANKVAMHIGYLYDKLQPTVEQCNLDSISLTNLLMYYNRGPYREYVYKDHVIYSFTHCMDVIEALCRNGWNLDPFPINYTDDRMKQEFQKFLPRHIAVQRAHAIISNKPENAVPLDLLLKHFNGRIEPKTVAWMISRMLNLACFFHTQGFHYLGFITRYLYVDPLDHQIYPYGGWWSVVKHGRPSFVTHEVVSALPFLKNKKQEIPDNADVILIKHTAQRLLGDPMQKTCPDDIPPAFRDWLFSSVGNKNPIDCYREWYRVLKDSWGDRKFTPCNVNIKLLFNIQL